MVISSANDPDYLEVVCLATGNKIIDPDNITNDGTCVIDSHAEVLTRRCFINYLYDMIDNYEHGDTILMRVDGSKFRLKPNIQVNLYVSSAPCGGCRIFTKSGNGADNHPYKLNRDQLRVKISRGEDQEPKLYYVKQTNRFGFSKIFDHREILV